MSATRSQNNEDRGIRIHSEHAFADIDLYL